MAMTKAQQEYALNRLKTIYSEKQKDLTEKYTTPEKRLKEEEKIALIIDQKVVFKDTKKFDYYTKLISAYDFSGWESPSTTSEEGLKLLAELQDNYRNTSDLIMLGDAVEALDAIQNFK